MATETIDRHRAAGWSHFIVVWASPCPFALGSTCGLEIKYSFRHRDQIVDLMVGLCRNTLASAYQPVKI